LKKYGCKIFFIAKKNKWEKNFKSWKRFLKINAIINFSKVHNYRNPSLGFATKAIAYKSAGQEWSLGVTFMFPKMWESVKEWTPTFPSELPLWEQESWWTPECSKSDCRGQNPLDWRVIYIIGKLLKLRCLKWARMTHLGI
jgi:hypothetical protein